MGNTSPVVYVRMGMPRVVRVVYTFAALLGLIPVMSTAMYFTLETRKVPIARMIANLERQVEAKPRDPDLAWRLGRLHGMAYAQGIDSVEVFVNNEEQEHYFTEEPPVVHSRVVTPEGKEKVTTAREHLEEAIKWYETAHTLAPERVDISLGYGWCLEQAGKKREAMEIYRDLIDKEFKKTEDPGRKAIFAEALHYLINLLDPVSDSNEVATRRAQLKELESWLTWVTPIAIPLGDGREIADILRDDLDVPFDVDGSGRDQRWTWIDPAAAWLVHDYGDLGDIRSGRDLFGNVTFWVFWKNGYEALAALDDNGDGWLRGHELRGLKLWNDLDSDGAYDGGELRTLTDCGIAGLCCGYTLTEHEGRRMWMSRDGVEFSDGSRRPSYDVVLEPRSADVASTRNRPGDLTR